MTNPTQLQALRGRALAPHPERREFVEWTDAVIRIDDKGRIATIDHATSGCDIAETWPGSVIVPGFVDSHLHCPQTRVLGSASGPLLTWLASSVFPEEARFADVGYASTVADEFCTRLLSQGTTSAAIYSSSHESATETLFAALAARGLRAAAGLTLMDRHAPPDVLLDTNSALAATAQLIETWHGHDRGRLRVTLNPRFAISCSPQLMRGAGELAQIHELLVQTHVSENLDELRQTRALFANQRDYLAVYEEHDCATANTILAHCIHLSINEWARVRQRDIAVAHCPDSNFFLGSGCMPLRSALDRGIRVGLGTDVGAGRTFSMRRVAAAAYDASLVLDARVEPEELLWLATRGGSKALRQDDHVGCISAGFDADLAVIDAPALPKRELIDTLLFRHDSGPVRATVVRGRLLHHQ